MRGHAFTPKRTVRYEHLVRMCALMAGVRKLKGPVRLVVRLYMPDARRRDGENCQKAIQDALNGVAYDDDSQVKVWSGAIHLDRDNPRAEVELCSLDWEDL